jgi:hypothetical protein
MLPADDRLSCGLGVTLRAQAAVRRARSAPPVRA